MTVTCRQCYSIMVTNCGHSHLLLSIGHLHQGDSSNTEDDNLMYPKRLKLEEENTSMKIKCNDIWLSWKQCCPIPETITGGTVVVIGSKVYMLINIIHQKSTNMKHQRTLGPMRLCVPNKSFVWQLQKKR